MMQRGKFHSAMRWNLYLWNIFKKAQSMNTIAFHILNFNLELQNLFQNIPLKLFRWKQLKLMIFLHRRVLFGFFHSFALLHTQMLWEQHISCLFTYYINNTCPFAARFFYSFFHFSLCCSLILSVLTSKTKWCSSWRHYVFLRNFHCESSVKTMFA